MSLLLDIVTSESIDDDAMYGENCCLVCGEMFEAEDKVTLTCKHSFCYDCLLESYKGKNCTYNNYTSSQRRCPYCRAATGYLPLKEGMKPLKGIHREYKSVKKSIFNGGKTGYYPTCQAILKSGPNKGLACNCKCAPGKTVCGRHKNWIPPSSS